MKGTFISTEQKPKQLICNFKAPSLADFKRWKEFVQWAQEMGLDVCHLTLSLTDSFMKGIEGKIVTGQQIIHIHQSNEFHYDVKKPRRVPYSLSCVKPQYQRTFSSVLFEAYVMEKARQISREFSYRDFLELKHDAFRRIVLRLKRKGKIVANPLRTVPRFYMLAERISVR